jgi:septal ring factor EnvC (AmiA/AmiB activator)
MKATSWIIVAALAILAIVFGVMWRNEAAKAKEFSTNAQELQKTIDDKTAASMGAEIQQGLDALEKELGLITNGNEFPAGTPEELKARNLNTLASIRAKIADYKKQITDLEGKLSSSKGQLAGIQSIVDKLKKSVADKEKIVSELEGRVGTLTTTLETERQTALAEINQREAQIKDKETIIANQNIESNRLYYVVGTRKQLLDNGIISRKGGILGIGKVSTVKDVDLAKFSEFNLLDTKQITFPATKKGYSVLSNHVAASYEVTRNGDEYVLLVTDSEQFRKQKVLVIELK